jgi:hypothetical protein
MAGTSPAKTMGLGFCLPASGRSGGDGGGGIERIDRWLADKEAEDLAEFVSFQI